MKKILIVEDESAIADTLIYILEAEGFEVSWVMLGSVAIDFIAKRDFDLVILDVVFSGALFIRLVSTAKYLPVECTLLLTCDTSWSFRPILELVREEVGEE